MAEKAKAKGTESPDAEGGGNQPEGERTFTQAELDALIRDRLARERGKKNEAIARANERLIKAEFIAAASRLQVKHPADAFALADRDAIEVTEGGKVVGVKEAVEKLVENGRLPLVGKPKAPDLDGGAGSGERAGDSKSLSEEEKRIAKKMGLTPEQYAAAKKKET